MKNYSNETINEHLKGSDDRKKLSDKITELKSSVIDIPMVINGLLVMEEEQFHIAAPHEHQKTIGISCNASKHSIELAINSALNAKEKWSNTPFEKRASIFLKAADLISVKHRTLMNAATMIGQGKNIYQSEIDCICELVDFLRFNVQFAEQIFKIQPSSSYGIDNKIDYRPLEGFVVAISPFNFTAIAGNLPCAPALMGNTVIWKPSNNQLYSAHFLMKILMEAGLPPGVINLVIAEGNLFGNTVFTHKYFAGVHFTGSSAVFDKIWLTISKNLNKYKTYPKIVGETGGKDFIVAHHSGNIKAIATAIIRGAFEFQGQKCSAASRAYIPLSMWEELKQLLTEQCQSIKIGSPENFENFMNAVISEKSFDKIMHYIELAQQSDDAEVIIGGKGDKSIGYFIEPTVILCKKADFITMKEEIFGPVISIFLYPDNKFSEILNVIDNTSEYALTGAIFSNDKSSIEAALKGLKNAAGNFYINDKPTGAVVNQQPFGGARKSGTNDKAGSMLNLLRWVSPQTIKENFNPPEDYTYPFMK